MILRVYWLKDRHVSEQWSMEILSNNLCFSTKMLCICMHFYLTYLIMMFFACVCSFTIDGNKDTWFSQGEKSRDGCTWEIKPFAYCIFRAAPSLDLAFFNPAGMHGDQIAVKIRRSGSLSQAKQTHGLGDRQRRRVLGVPWPLSKAVMGPTWAFCSPEAVGVIICQGARGRSVYMPFNVLLLSS